MARVLHCIAYHYVSFKLVKFSQGLVHHGPCLIEFRIDSANFEPYFTWLSWSAGVADIL